MEWAGQDLCLKMLELIKDLKFESYPLQFKSVDADFDAEEIAKKKLRAWKKTLGGGTGIRGPHEDKASFYVKANYTMPTGAHTVRVQKVIIRFKKNMKFSFCFEKGGRLPILVTYLENSIELNRNRILKEKLNTLFLFLLLKIALFDLSSHKSLLYHQF